MTPEARALSLVIELLERQGIPYMLTGSVASSYYGRPRSTHDADLVIDPTRDQVMRFVGAATAAGFYADGDAAVRALERRAAFNVIEMSAACKIDLIVRRERPFSVEEFSRRRIADLDFRSGVALVSPEDAIVSKLEWAHLSGASERQLNDIRGVLDVTTGIDLDYIDRWAVALGLRDLWGRVSNRG